MPDARNLDEAERRALHDVKIAVEHVQRAYGSLLEFHHEIGRAMDRLYDAEADLRAAGREELADELRDVHLPSGVVGDMWSYELVEAFREQFLADLVAYGAGVREEIADGDDHVAEREQQRRWRERADGDDWKRGVGSRTPGPTDGGGGPTPEAGRDD